MKTFLKIIAGLILLLLIAAVCVALYFRFFFDPNDLRDQVTKQVQEKTGRDLVIEGDLQISTFPWVSIDIGRTTLSDYPIFGSEPLLAFEKASASIKLMPLLSKRIELGTTSIDGARINLIRLADEKTNWDALLYSLASKDDTQTPETESGFATDSLGAIDITNAVVVFKDQLPNAEYAQLTLSGLSLSTGELKPGAAFDLDLSTRIDADNVGLDVAMKARLKQYDDYLELSNPLVTLNGSHYAVPFKRFEVELESDRLALGDTTVELSATTIDWQVAEGQDSASDLQSGAGQLTVAAMGAKGENFTLEEPNVTFEFGLAGSSLKSLKGSLESDNISQAGSQLEIKTPTLKFDATGAEASITSAVGTLVAQAITLQDNAKLGLNQVVLSTTVNGESIPDGPQEFSANLQELLLNLDSGAMNVNAYTFDGLGLKGKGALTGSNVMKAATVRGPVVLEAFNLRELLTSLNVELDTADASALTQAQGKVDLHWSPAGLELRQLDATLDQSKMTGLIKLTGDIPEVALTIDKLALDGYLSAPDNVDGEDRAVDTIELPAQQLRELNLNGQLRIGALNAGGIDSTNVEVQIAANQGDVRVHPVKAQLYGGTYSGDIQIDAQGEVPKMSLNESFNDVDFGALSLALADSQRLSGRVTGSLKMSASGHNTRDLKATSNGSVAFAFKDGVLDGVNVMETVRNIVAAANKEPLTADEPNKTEFRKLEGTATITNGVLANNDLAIDIPLMRVNGQGTLDLNTKQIDYRVGARVVQEGDVPLEKELQFISDYTLPLVIGGTYEAPVVDKTGSIADLIKQYAKKRIKDRLLDRLGLGSKEEPEEAGTATQGDTPDETSPDAVPEPPAEPPLEPKEQLKDDLDQALKDKLKDLLGD